MIQPDKIQAVGSWVLVKLVPIVRVLPSGIYLPDDNISERLGHHSGVVLSFGKKAASVNKGDRVMFRGYLKEANRPCGILDTEYSLIHINDIIGVIV